MLQRFAIYFAPAAGSPLDHAAEAWLSRPDLAALTVSARRYGFHATIKAPMALAEEASLAELSARLIDFARRAAPVRMGLLAPRLIDGFLAIVPVEQPQALTDFAADVVRAFDYFRAPLGAADRARRLKAPLTARQIELLDRWGYPYVLDEFRFHMTLTDRLAPPVAETLLAEAIQWFAPTLEAPVLLDRLVVFREAAEGAAFERLAPDYLLGESA